MAEPDLVEKSSAVLAAVGFQFIPLLHPIAGVWSILCVSPARLDAGQPGVGGANPDGRHLLGARRLAARGTAHPDLGRRVAAHGPDALLAEPMPEPSTGPPARLEGVGKRQDDSMLGSPVCRACGATIPRPRRGQRACSPRCRWRLWRGRQAEQCRATTSRDEEIRALLETALKKLGGGGP